MELEVVFKEEREDIKSEWEKDVPIIARGKTVTAYLMGEIYEPECYSELCYTLENTNADYVRLVMNNGGGHMDSMISIIASIKKCQATVVGVLSGTIASAASMIALECDELEVADHLFWLTHYYSGGTAGKGNEIKAKHIFDEVEIPRMFKAIHKGFLTDAEMERVIDGKDEWLNKEEVLKRFANKKAAK